MPRQESVIPPEKDGRFRKKIFLNYPSPKHPMALSKGSRNVVIFRAVEAEIGLLAQFSQLKNFFVSIFPGFREFRSLDV